MVIVNVLIEEVEIKDSMPKSIHC